MAQEFVNPSADELRAFTEQMQKVCRGMHVDFNRMNSGEPLDVALSGFLATRAASIRTT